MRLQAARRSGAADKDIPLGRHGVATAQGKTECLVEEKERLVRGRKSLGLLQLHVGVAARQEAFTGLGDEDLRPALAANVPSAQLISQ